MAEDQDDSVAATMGVLNRYTGMYESKRLAEMSGIEIERRIKKNSKSRIKWAEALLAQYQLLDSPDVEDGRSEVEAAVSHALTTLRVLQTARNKLLTEQAARAADGVGPSRTRAQEEAKRARKYFTPKPKCQVAGASDEDDEEEDDV